MSKVMSIEGILIRKAIAKDAKTIYNLGNSVEAFNVTKDDSFWSLEQIEHWIKSSKITKEVLLVATDSHSKKIVGFILTQFHEPTGSASIENIFIKEEYQGKGIGKRLVEECLRRYKKQDTNFINLIVNSTNTKSIEFFKKIGFKKGFLFTWFHKFL